MYGLETASGTTEAIARRGLVFGVEITLYCDIRALESSQKSVLPI